MTEPLDRSRENALSAIRKTALDQSVDVKAIDVFLERFVDIGYRNQFNDTDRTVAKSELKVLLDQVTSLFESNKDED